MHQSDARIMSSKSLIYHDIRPIYLAVITGPQGHEKTLKEKCTTVSY